MTIKEIREELGWTQHKFSWEAGVSITTVSKWENSGKGLDDIHQNTKYAIERIMKNHGIKAGKA